MLSLRRERVRWRTRDVKNVAWPAAPSDYSRGTVYIQRLPPSLPGCCCTLSVVLRLRARERATSKTIRGLQPRAITHVWLCKFRAPRRPLCCCCVCARSATWIRSTQKVPFAAEISSVPFSFVVQRTPAGLASFHHAVSALNQDTTLLARPPKNPMCICCAWSTHSHRAPTRDVKDDVRHVIVSCCSRGSLFQSTT